MNNKKSSKGGLVDIYCKQCGQYLCSTYPDCLVMCEKCKVWTEGPKWRKGRTLSKAVN